MQSVSKKIKTFSVSIKDERYDESFFQEISLNIWEQNIMNL